jgi:hypothetical protein
MFPYRRKGQFKDTRAQFFIHWTVAECMAKMSLMDAEAMCVERLKQAVEGNPLAEALALMTTAFPEEAERFFFSFASQCFLIIRSETFLPPTTCQSLPCQPKIVSPSRHPSRQNALRQIGALDWSWRHGCFWAYNAKAGRLKAAWPRREVRNMDYEIISLQS